MGLDWCIMTLVKKNELEINSLLYEFINNDVLPGTGITQELYWKNFSNVANDTILQVDNGSGANTTINLATQDLETLIDATMSVVLASVCTSPNIFTAGVEPSAATNSCVTISE